MIDSAEKFIVNEILIIAWLTCFVSNSVGDLGSNQALSVTPVLRTPGAAVGMFDPGADGSAALRRRTGGEIG
jgi:hypothetical protein